jgi:hypothetical protein
MDKCPFCRAAFPNIICRIAHASSVDEACKIYSKVFEADSKKANTEDKICTAIVNFLRDEEYDADMFQKILDMFIQDNSKLYVKLIGFLEEEVFFLQDLNDFDEFANVIDLLFQYHYSETKLMDLRKQIIDIQERKDKEEEKAYQKGMYKARNMKRRTKFAYKVPRRNHY